MAKVTVLGTGMVGASFAYRLLNSGLASEMLLVDANHMRAEGEMMDLNHAMPFEHPCQVEVGDYADIKGSEVVVISAGAAQRPGETRLDLVQRNAAIFRDMIPQVAKAAPEAIMVIATNPVDIMTQAAIKYSEFAPERVVGSGTILDTARFRYLLGEYYGVDPRSVHAYIIGEHGDSEVPAFSCASIAGVPLADVAKQLGKEYDLNDMEDIFQQVRTAAYEIINRKGSTYYAIASGLLRVTEAILRDQSTAFSVSNVMTGQYGIKDVCLSLPMVVSRKGITATLTLPLNEKELEGFRHSAQVLGELAAKTL
ncbi:MAG: L-lactate dehydrogenase [Chloroflexi bacterium]|uniref:L-lactate dehydrogenase n=1 Tax=Candidatus Chlorohelix allophototropha TaxID=3003348 RepID=A0A8T7M8P6_9CHLR|nr:L-lactate dehydrogenase [Chloroflexota bacterium]WJW68443.1 L-lactate dehydrogenase [Chloroflexota bacterium L227-S17]